MLFNCFGVLQEKEGIAIDATPKVLRLTFGGQFNMRYPLG